MQGLITNNVEVNIYGIIGLIILSFLLGSALAVVYKRTHRGMPYPRSFPYSLSILPIIICMIMLAIGSSISLSLGLVGSLSVLRFRTAIKDTRDMIFLFACIAAGLSSGSGNITLAIIGISLFIISTLIIDRLNFFMIPNHDFLLAISVSDPKENQISLLEEILKSHCQNWKTKSYIQNFDNKLDLTYDINLNKQKTINQLVNDIMKIHPKNFQVRAITPDSTISI